MSAMGLTELWDEHGRAGEDPFLAEFKKVDVVQYHRQRAIAQGLMEGHLKEGGIEGLTRIGNYDPAAPDYKEESLRSNGFHFTIYAEGGMNVSLPWGVGAFLLSKGCVLDGSKGGLSAGGRVLHARIPFGLVETEEAGSVAVSSEEAVAEVQVIRDLQRRVLETRGGIGRHGEALIDQL